MSCGFRVLPPRPRSTGFLALCVQPSWSRVSNQVNVKAATDLEKNKEKIENTVPLKESLIINFESKGSLKNAEVTSSTGMTLPTGVSTFLLECLDVDSTADYNTGDSDSLNSCPSPETFRDDRSATCVLTNFETGALSQKETIKLQLQFFSIKCFNYSGRTGKKGERSLINQPGCNIDDLLLPRPDNQTAKPERLKCKKKEKNSSTLEGGTSSFGQLGAPGNTSAKSVGLTAAVVPSKWTDAVVQMSSTMLIVEENKALKNLGFAQPAELDPLCGRQEICSIVRTSPCRRPSRLHQIPVNTKAFCIPEGVPEDTITSTKNWIYCKHR
ncbi:PREDICTED: uncharacterized protein LOC103915851 [Pygoscelis adeliae]|uniref:uncharacterized protein LOC103915851 n=1 Tax=Pygoscelis adeliae TaxID=9238 RepID=UPI0004F50C98|nr:PREDICTED: uncharacterized protein LOC103915851 [Pygoscelis adeliae]